MPLYEVSISGSLATGTNQTPLIRILGTETITRITADVKTAPTGASIILDVNKNGSTIWSTQINRLSVSSGAVVGSQTTFDTTSLTDGDLLTIDLDQVGSGTPGADLTIAIKTS